VINGIRGERLLLHPLLWIVDAKLVAAKAPAAVDQTSVGAPGGRDILITAEGDPLRLASLTPGNVNMRGTCRIRDERELPTVRRPYRAGFRRMRRARDARQLPAR